MCLDCECGARPRRPNKSRKKLWELDDRFHCSVIGTCLSLEELRRICRKAGIVFEAPASDYELHTSFVGMAGEKTYPTQLLQKHLERKFRSTLLRFAAAQSSEDFESLWRESVDKGEIAGAFWAIVTSAEVSATLLLTVHGEVHMLSHLSGASLRVDMQQLAQLKKRAPALESELAVSRRQQQLQEKTIKNLHAQLDKARQAERELHQIREELHALRSEESHARLHRQLAEYERRIDRLAARVESAETQAAEWKQLALQHSDGHLQLEQKVADLTAERDALERTVERMLQPECNSCSYNDHCSARIDLGGRCVLYVGGRNQQCANFRALVEQQNGRFLHHDGGREDGRARLGSILSQADVVLCPLDCVSHSAVIKIKRYCERYTKRLVLLPRASLSAFARGLHEVAA